MKYLSGDFLAEYNRALSEFQKEQNKLDEKWSKVINDLVEEEISHLEESIPKNFKVGQKVRDTNGNVGVVKACPVVLNVFEDEDYHGKKYGPNKFFAIRNQLDEEAVTCEGMLRMVDVSLKPNILEEDWGVDEKVARYYEDELKIKTD